MPLKAVEVIVAFLVMPRSLGCSLAVTALPHPCLQLQVLF